MRIGGKVEVFTRRAVNGWLATFGEQLERPQLELMLDDTVLATVTADGFRPDVANKGLGDGQCQFQITLPEALTDDEANRVRLRIVGSEVFLELPRGPVRNQVSAVSSAGQPASPVFIVGSPRSGTSVMTRALAAAGYHGFEEGNLLGLAQIADQNVGWYFNDNDTESPGTLLGNVNQEGLKRRIFGVFKEVVESLNPVSPWFDKTGNPETIFLLPRIMEAWPLCRIIFAKRRGIENVRSRVAKFPERDFAYHCRDWAANMKAWRVTKPQLDTSRLVEVDQQQMLDEPSDVASLLHGFLGITSSGRELMEQVFRTERPQERFPGSAAQKVGLAQANWTDDQIKTFEELCGDEMRSFGYQ